MTESQSTPERDPRADPRPGDVVDWGEGPQTVRYVEADNSVWVVDEQVDAVGVHCSEFWRKWAAGAVVMKRGSE